MIYICCGEVLGVVYKLLCDLEVMGSLGLDIYASCKHGKSILQAVVMPIFN